VRRAKEGGPNTAIRQSANDPMKWVAQEAATPAHEVGASGKFCLSPATSRQVKLYTHKPWINAHTNSTFSVEGERYSRPVALRVFAVSGLCKSARILSRRDQGNRGYSSARKVSRRWAEPYGFGDGGAREGLPIGTLSEEILSLLKLVRASVVCPQLPIQLETNEGTGHTCSRMKIGGS
jgi:hypothetical protein